MAGKTTGKFSVYIKDSQLRRAIEIYAHFSGISITELVSIALKEYVDKKQEVIKSLLQHDEECRELVQLNNSDAQQAEASTDAQAAIDDDGGQQAEQEQAENENWRRTI